MPIHSITHEGRETTYRERRNDAGGAPVVFVHGTGASHAVWRAQFRLARQHPVIAVDLSGHGESADIDAEPGWETLSAYTSDVEAIVEAEEAEFVVGHSLGGAVALHLAGSRACDLAGIGVIGTGRRLPVHDDILRMAEEDFEALIAFLHAPDRLFHDPDEETVAASSEAMRACGQAVVLRDFLTSDAIDLRTDLESIEPPVLALCGTHDRLTPVHVHANLVEELPNARLQVIDGAAHAPMLEAPTPVNEALQSFFAEPAEFV